VRRSFLALRICPRNVSGRESAEETNRELGGALASPFSISIRCALIDHTWTGGRAGGRTAARAIASLSNATWNLAEDKSRFVYMSFGDRSSVDRLAKIYRCGPDFADIKSNSALYLSRTPCEAAYLFLPLSLSLSVAVFSSTAVPIPRVVLSPRPACRRLLHRAFALEVISKNFWRWIVPRDGNRGLTLPAAFTQTTEETTFASVRVTTVRLTINERNNTRDSRDSSSESARASCRAGRDEICGCGGFHTAEMMTKNEAGDVGKRRIESCKQPRNVSIV